MTAQTHAPVPSSNRGLPLLLRPALHAWAMERSFVAAAGLDRGMTILDLGCGDGAVTRFLAGEVGLQGRVVALDVDEPVVNAQREADAERDGTPIDWVCASAYDTGLEADSVDFVFARHLFAHLTDPGRALAEIRRVLRPGGRLCLLDAHDGLLWIHPEPHGHAAFMSRAAEQQRLRGGDRDIARKLSALLAEHGFDDVRSDVHVFDTSRLSPDLFVSIALEPMLAMFPGHGADEARRHVLACGEAMGGGRAHGSAGFYATAARRA